MATLDSPEVLEALKEIETGNYSVAFRLLNASAEAGNPKAQCNLANLYHFSWGVNTNGEKSIVGNCTQQ